MRKFLFLGSVLCSLSLFSGGSGVSGNLSQEEIRLHYQTNWQIEPSLIYDSICLLNTLTADPFYLKYYKSEYEEFKKKLTGPVRNALAGLKQKIKDKNKSVISAFLCLYFSATENKTLDDMLKTIGQSDLMQKKLKKTPYYSEYSWQLYESVREELEVIFLFLKDIQFESYWRKYILPKAYEKIRKIQKELSKYNITAEVEAHLGFKLSSHRITVYLLYFSKPHAIKITGTRFLTNVDWPFKITVRNAVHEMMHPPFNRADKKLKVAVDLLKKDKFLMDRVLNHDPAYGYNTFDGFIEEDCVHALEQIINEKLQIEIDPQKKWKETDGGMHVFAAALYSVMKKKNFPKNNEAFSDFLIRMIQTGELAPGKIKSLYNEFYGRRP